MHVDGNLAETQSWRMDLQLRLSRRPKCTPPLGHVGALSSTPSVWSGSSHSEPGTLGIKGGPKKTSGRQEGECRREEVSVRWHIPVGGHAWDFKHHSHTHCSTLGKEFHLTTSLPVVDPSVIHLCFSPWLRSQAGPPCTFSPSSPYSPEKTHLYPFILN